MSLSRGCVAIADTFGKAPLLSAYRPVCSLQDFGRGSHCIPPAVHPNPNHFHVPSYPLSPVLELRPDWGEGRCILSFFFFFSLVNDFVAGNCRCTVLGWMSAELDVKKGRCSLNCSLTGLGVRMVGSDSSIFLNASLSLLTPLGEAHERGAKSLCNF